MSWLPELDLEAGDLSTETLPSGSEGKNLPAM